MQWWACDMWFLPQFIILQMRSLTFGLFYAMLPATASFFFSRSALATQHMNSCNMSLYRNWELPRRTSRERTTNDSTSSQSGAFGRCTRGVCQINPCGSDVCDVFCHPWQYNNERVEKMHIFISLYTCNQHIHSPPHSWCEFQPS